MKNYLPNLLITGGNGQLASAMRQNKLAKFFNLRFLARDDLDITDLSAVDTCIEKYKPSAIINTAAYTAVDKAETEQEQAALINYQGSKNLAIVCKKFQIPLLHVSTDYVFDGTSSSPYQENHSTSPINHYGKTKWLGEEAIREICEQHIILRVSGVFSEYGNNFLKTILRLGKERKELRIVADQITCPTYAGDIASALFTIVSKPGHWGTYHYCSDTPTSWHEFAKAIVDEAKHQHTLVVEDVKAITTSDYPTAAKRPAFSVLDFQKALNIFEIQPSNWKAGIRKSLEKLR